MDFLVKLIEFARGSMDIPTNYGWFHLTFVTITVVASILMCVFFGNASEKRMRTACFVMWVIIVVLEIYKQLMFTYSVSDGVIVADYWWEFFPFQLCSSPLYILPFVAFLPSGRLHDMMCSFMIAFSIFGGICVYVFPGDVFCEYIGINIQTMIHHGIQIVSGVFLAAWCRNKLKIKYYLGGAVIFGVMMAIAMVLNLVVTNLLRGAGIDDKFSMFYVSPYEPCHLPILSMIYPLVPFPVFLVIYFLGFMLAAAIIFYIAKGIAALCRLFTRGVKNAA